MVTQFPKIPACLMAALCALSLTAAARTPQVGSPAPNFYPKDATPGCTTQACEFRDNVFAFDKEGAVILGVSVDDVASHKAFARKHGLPFTLLADSDKTVTRRYGVLKTYMGVMELARRDTFLIDPQGLIAKHYESVEPEGHSKVVLADIKALKAARPGGQ